MYFQVPEAGLEPASLSAIDFESIVFANFTTLALQKNSTNIFSKNQIFRGKGNSIGSPTMAGPLCEALDTVKRCTLSM